MDNYDGEWGMAYHGASSSQSSNNVKKVRGIIYKGNFKALGIKAHANCSDKFHEGILVWEGVNFTPNIAAAEVINIMKIKIKKIKIRMTMMMRIKIYIMKEL